MDAKYITPFIEASDGVFQEFFGIKPEIRKPYWVDSADIKEWEVSAIIGIAGETRGCVVLSFSKMAAEKLTSILVGRDISVVDDDVVDTIGEVVNIIAGNAKKGLEQFKLMISLPSVVRGKEHNITFGGKQIPVIGIPMDTPHGMVHLSVGLENIIKQD